MRSRARLGNAVLSCLLVALAAAATAAATATVAATAWAGSPPAAGSGTRPGVRTGAARPEPLGYRVLRQDVIINADIWNRRPEMMAAGLGFTRIIGVPNLSTSNVTLSKTLAVLAGGTWNKPRCAPGQTPSLSNYTSAATPSGIRYFYGQAVYYSDGLPVEFSWPIVPSTLDPSDFRITLNNGTTVTPQVTSIYPNFEYNERSVAVLFGHFGNRIPAGRPGAIYPVSVRVVRGASKLMLAGPHHRLVSAVGFKVASPGTPYTAPGVPAAKRGGPVLVAAKLSRMSVLGDTAPKILQQNLPNDGVSLYGSRARFRLRVYTSGGMTPNGVSALLPTDYDQYFVVDAVTASGRTVRLVRSGRTYYIDGHPLRVIGLADLGKKEKTYNDCYTEDGDNYVDIILDGSAAAARRIRTVQIPSAGRYRPLYNPGGPGNDPAPGVHYSAPSPPISQPVTIALRNPETVTYIHCPHQPPRWSLPAKCVPRQQQRPPGSR